MNGYDPYALSPDLYQRQAQALRQKQIAEALMQQAMTPLESTQAGGYVVPVTPLQSIAKVAQALAGARVGKKAETEMSQLQEQATSRRSQLLAAALSGDQEAASKLMSAGDPTMTRLMQSQMEQASQPRLLMENELPQGFQLPQGAQAYGTPGRITRLDVDRAQQSSPMSVKEWEYYSALPKDQQLQYLSMKRAAQFQDLGGYIAPVDPRIGALNPMAGTMKTLPPQELPEVKGAQAQAAAVGTATGKSAVEAQTSLPQSVAKAEQAMTLIDQIAESPGFDTLYGKSGAFGVAGMVPGSEARDARAKLDQLQGRAFLEAFETLKGGGQITQVEGEKATKAISRIFDTGQSDESARQALKELRDVIEAGMKRAKTRAGVQEAPRVIDWSELP